MLLCMAVCLMACPSAKKAQQSEHYRSVPPDFHLSLERTSCFGQCPTYKIEVNAKGIVTYRGKNFVDKVGTYRKKISKKQLLQLVNAIEEAGFWSFEKLYDDHRVTDIPSVVTTCKMDGKEKKVINRNGGPEQLEALEREIERIIGEEGYKPVADQP